MLEARRADHPLRVAIDGPDAAGKTTLADELAGLLARRRRPVVRASLDGFQRPRAERYRRGRDSPRGYYEDAFDLDALRESLLDPLGPDGSRRFRRATFDYRRDEPADAAWEHAPRGAVLLLDGVFLLRPELRAFWDASVFVSASMEECLRRGVRRDADALGGPDVAARRYRDRYLAAQRRYLERVRPAELADAVLENDRPAAPSLRVRGG